MRKPDRELGASGEKLARTRLEMALQGACAQFSGFDDKGVDLLIQFQPIAPYPAPLYVGVQVKTGTSFADAEGAHWRVKNIAQSDVNKWTGSNVPILLVWVRPGPPDEYLWTLITKETNISEIRIARNSRISPAIRYDLLPRFQLPSPTFLAGPIELCRPPLGKGLRQHAKEYYRGSLMAGTQPVNPVLGPVTFSWAGWHHLTVRGRRAAYIQSSLQILTASHWAIENPTRLIGVRSLPSVTRGSWVWESRLLAFECSKVPIRYRAEADLVVVVRQEIIYPQKWFDDVNLSKRIRSSSRFFSIYERDPRVLQLGTQR
jgi:Domain of unknown function (DUF4365)